jgi:hypothetical protein
LIDGGVGTPTQQLRPGLSARSSSLPSTSLAVVEQSRRQIERNGRPPELEARTLQVGEEICR